uniref:Peptidase M23 n=1 Tax=Dictyoglomus thermophilum TaxID=14 RepID=A0A7V3ZH88_DICTH
MRTLISIILVLTLIIVLVYGADTSSIILQKQKELQQKQKQIQSLKQQIKTLESTEFNVVREISKIDYELDKAERELNVAESRLREAQAKLNVLSTQLNILQRNLKYRSLNFKENLGESYKLLQSKNSFSLIFLNDSFSQIAVPYYLKSLMKLEAGRLNNLNTQCRDIEQTKKKWEEEKRKVEALVRSIAEKKAYIERKKNEKLAYLEKIRTQKRYQQQVVATLERESKEIEQMIRKLASSNIQKAQKGRLSWPVIGSITSGFGMRRHPILGGAPLFHTGVDIAASYGTPVRAAASGRIIFAGWYGGYGNMVIIDHGGKISTVYGHLSKIVVRVGEEIAEGDIIGYVGTTGLSTGPHLHFEVRVNGDPVDPLSWLIR